MQYSENTNNAGKVIVFCPSCGYKFSHKITIGGAATGGLGGMAAGAAFGAKIGIVGGPLGAIAGTIPGAILGALFGKNIGKNIDNPRCPSCSTKFDVPNNIIGNRDITLNNSNVKLGEVRRKFPVLKGQVRTESYGLTNYTPILLTSVQSTDRFLETILANNSKLSYLKLDSVKYNNLSQPIDKYEFSKNGKFLVIIYIYPYHTSNLDIIPQILY